MRPEAAVVGAMPPRMSQRNHAHKEEIRPSFLICRECCSAYKSFARIRVFKLSGNVGLSAKALSFLRAFWGSHDWP